MRSCKKVQHGVEGFLKIIWLLIYEGERKKSFVITMVCFFVNSDSLSNYYNSPELFDSTAVCHLILTYPIWPCHCDKI